MSIHAASFPLPPHLRIRQEERNALLSAIVASPDWRQTSKLWRTGELFFLALCGGAFALAFPAWNWGFLGWAGLVPLLWLSINVTASRAALNGYIWGFAFAFCSFNWFREIGAAFPFVAAAVLATFPAVWAMCLPFLRKNILLPLHARLGGHEAQVLALACPPAWRELFFMVSASLLWVTVEWIRSWIATGLPWNTLAVTQWQNPDILQLCEYTSFYGVSFILALGNMAVWSLLRDLSRMIRSGIYARPWNTMIILCFIVAVLITVSRRGQDEARNNPALQKDPSDRIVRVGVVQSNTPVSWGKPSGDKQAILNRLINQSIILAKSQKPDFIVWPETAVPMALRYSLEYQQGIQALSHAIGIPMIIGSSDRDDAGRYTNTAFLINPNGKIADRYDKVHIVPFGEFIPFGRTLDALFPDLRRRFMLPEDLSAGNRFNPLGVIDGVRLGISICFEDVFSYVTREEVLAGANLLLTITNDAWYPASDEREQHLASALFRAIETRSFVVRTGNMARACLIDPSGRIVRWHDMRSGVPFDGMQTADGTALFEIAVPRRLEKTFFVRYGDLFAVLCAFATLMILFGCAWRWRTFQKALLPEPSAPSGKLPTPPDQEI